MSDAPEQNEQQQLNQPALTTEAQEGQEPEKEAQASVAVESEVRKSQQVVGEEKTDSSRPAIEPPAVDTRRNSEDEVDQALGTGGTQTPKPVEGAVADQANAPSEAEPAGTVTEPSEPTPAPTAVETSEDAAPSPSVTHTSLRPLSPSSRTSTPPLTGTAAPVAKKFSAINVNKKFLSKTGSTPSPSNASSSVKLNPLSNRPISSPVPIVAPSSRLLSTKLTTTSASTKPPVSPQPPSSASTSSPWAKPALTPADATGSGAGPKSLGGAQGSASLSATMGQGQGLASARPAWRAVNAEGKRAPMGMSRDFPTAKEVADGKKAAASAAVNAAQVQAAHAAAIMHNLDAFSHLDHNGHSWVDDDDEDDIIDFGGSKLRDLTSTNAGAPKAPAPRPEPPLDQPVSKSERFVEDFDRSWPRSAQQAAEEAARVPELRKRESDRVLFNASSNRLEHPSSRGQHPQPPQPTRLMSRSDARAPAPQPPTDAAPPSAPGPAGARNLQRQPPPHLAGAPEAGRQIPPHMADAAPSRQAPPPAQQGARIAWGQHREAERQLPPHLAQKPDAPSHSTAFDAAARSPTRGPGSALPPRRSFGQATAPPPPAPHAEPISAAPATADPTDSQAAEMHSAAEKARLRREAEEVERKAAAERAKQKARELEARLGLTSTARSPATETIPAPPAAVATPSYTIAQRPKPPTETVTTATAVHAPAAPAPTHLSARPPLDQRRSQEDHWRSRQPPHAATNPPAPTQAPGAREQQPRLASTAGRPGRPTAESFFETAPPVQEPPVHLAVAAEAGPSTNQLLHAEAELLLDEVAGEASAQKDHMFDDTLARIKAVMNKSAATASVDPRARQQDVRRRTSDSQQARPAPPQPKRTPDVPEFFDVTRTEIPRSPPPAWRTYAVKIPKDQRTRNSVPASRSSVLQRARRPARGWLMSFDPPLDLPNQSLSRTDVLIPAPNARRFSRKEATPLVNISRSKLEPFQHEAKSHAAPSATTVSSRSEPGTSRPAPTGHQVQSRASGLWRAADEAALLAPEPIATQVTVDLLDAPVPKAKPIAPSPADVARSADGYRAVGFATSRQPAVSATDPKAGVRFMVSSELEGDSLLDEVNKMSLETVEEAGAKGQSSAIGASIQRPHSPTTHGTASAPRTHPSSPNGTVPWTSSHEHLKNVWQAPTQQQPPAEAQPTTTAAATTADPAALTPVFPSLNAPSVADPPAATSQAKLSYASQTFSPTSTAFTSLRQSPGIGYSTSPATPGEGLPAAGYSRNHAGANGYSAMGQQGMWSSTPFGSAAFGTSGYGYPAKSANPADQKAAMAFNAAGAAGSAYQYGGQLAGYSSLGSTQSPYAQHQFSTHQGQQHRMGAAQNGAYGYQPYGQASQSQSGRSSRFIQPNGNNADYGHLDGSYYGYVGAAGQSGQANQSHGMYYTSSTGAAVGQGGSRPQHGAHPSAGQRGKMW